MQAKIKEIKQRALAANLPVESYDGIKLGCVLGILATATFAYRDKYNTLCVGMVAAENVDILKNHICLFAIKKNTKLIYDDNILINEYDMSNNAWYIYFHQPFENVDIQAFNGIISPKINRNVSRDQLQKAFDCKITIPQGDATERQLATIRAMILENKLAPVSQDKWTFMTKTEASQLIGSATRSKVVYEKPSLESQKWLNDFDKLPEAIQNEIKNKLKK